MGVFIREPGNDEGCLIALCKCHSITELDYYNCSRCSSTESKFSTVNHYARVDLQPYVTPVQLAFVRHFNARCSFLWALF